MNTLKQIPCLFKFFVRGAIGFSKYILGYTRSSDAEAERRMAICGGCMFEYNSKLFGVRRCGSCGCFIKPKAYVGTEPCPLGKWDGDHPA
jgi:hypothetical protein